MCNPHQPLKKRTGPPTSNFPFRAQRWRLPLPSGPTIHSAAVAHPTRSSRGRTRLSMAASRFHQCHASSRSRLARARRWTWSLRAARPCGTQHRLKISALRMGGLPYESAMRHDGRHTRDTAVAAPGDVSNRVDGSAGKLNSGSERWQLIRKTACVGVRYSGRNSKKPSVILTSSPLRSRRYLHRRLATTHAEVITRAN